MNTMNRLELQGNVTGLRRRGIFHQVRIYKHTYNLINVISKLKFKESNLMIKWFNSFPKGSNVVRFDIKRFFVVIFDNKTFVRWPQEKHKRSCVHFENVFVRFPNPDKYLCQYRANLQCEQTRNTSQKKDCLKHTYMRRHKQGWQPPLWRHRSDWEKMILWGNLTWLTGVTIFASAVSCLYTENSLVWVSTPAKDFV